MPKLPIMDSLRQRWKRSITFDILKTQKEKYKCPKCGDIISVHDRKCYVCGYIKP